MSLKTLIAGAYIALSALGCGPELKHNVDICKGALPVKYEQYLENNQNIASSLIWEGSTKLQYAEDCSALKDLTKHIDGRIELTGPPVPEKTETAELFRDEEASIMDEKAFYKEQSAWDMYLSHIAHSLTLEVEDSLPWKINEHDRETIRLLLDGRNFIVKKGSLYTFEHVPSNARYRVTDWSSKPVFDFMVENDMLKETELDTLYSITEWMTENLVHFNEETPEDWDNYPGAPPIDKILKPPKGISWTWGCWGTTSLYLSMLQAANIPAERGYSYFAKSANPNNAGWHSRPEFPTLGIGLAHGDDPYSLHFKGHYHKVPVERIFLTFNQLEQLIDNPEIVKEEDGYKPKKAEMASFNSSRYSLELAAEYQSDFLMYVRAFEILDGFLIYGTLDDVLKGKCWYTGKLEECFWKHLFDAKERETIINSIDDAILELGNGDLKAGAREAIHFKL